MSVSASPLVSALEAHRIDRVGWLRAAVLGANDGIVSTASLVSGVAAAGAAHADILLAGVAGLVAGAMSMAAGEYVSVSSQSDTESADLAREREELATDAVGELAELTQIYVDRGLSRALAEAVAVELTAHDALGAHARDELGITDFNAARPLQAALTSAVTFALGAGVPLGVAALVPASAVLLSVAGATLACLAALGGLGAGIGGASPARGAVRVTFWGLLALGATALVGRLFGTVV